jgi:hypothetical protein
MQPGPWRLAKMQKDGRGVGAAGNQSTQNDIHVDCQLYVMVWLHVAASCMQARTCGSLASVRGSWLSSDTLGALPSLMLLPLPHPHLYRCADADWAVQSLAVSRIPNIQLALCAE